MESRTCVEQNHKRHRSLGVAAGELPNSHKISDSFAESYFENLEVLYSNSVGSFEISETWIFKMDISPSQASPWHLPKQNHDH
jgi:hypothetical protein